jgi:beta-glucosidase
MTLQEKIGQMNQINGRNPSDELYRQIRSGEVGSILNIGSVELVNELQKNSHRRIEIGHTVTIARDVIHGFKTMFPIPGQAASFNPEMVELGARIAAKSFGKRYSMDICTYDGYFERCPLGRIAESFEKTLIYQEY